MNNGLRHDTRQILIRARALIERGWTQKCTARNKAGIPCSVCDDDASAWSISGALDAAKTQMFGLMDSAAFHDATQTLRDVIFPQSKGPSHLSLPDWNDTPGRTKDEVLAPFDDAIGRL